MGADEFRIIVEHENKLICQCPGQRLDAQFERAALQDLQTFELARRTIAVFNSWLSDDKARDRDTMSVIGSHLYTLLFPDTFDRLFRSLLYERRAGGASAPLRVVLEFKTPAAWLAELPWEFLYLPDTQDQADGFFLSAQSDLILTRTVQLNAPPLGAPRLDRPPRILLVLSEPSLEDAVSEDLVKALQQLHGQEGGAEVRLYVREGSGVGRVKGPTRKDLRQWVNDPDFQPDIVHFVGHGRYRYSADTRLEKGELALVRADNGESDWCSDKDLADMFDRRRLPKVVFLHACESGRTASYRGFKGVAQSLIKSGVPNVVAMQYPVENVVATRFARTFYEALLAGAPIDTAVQRGRETLGLELHELAGQLGGSAEHFNDRRFGSPVVFVQQWLGLSLFGRGATAAAPDAASDEVDLASECACPYGKCRSLHMRDSRFCDQGHGPLQTCVERSCRRLMKKGALSCPYCGTAQGADERAPVLGRAPAAAGAEGLAAADRFRTAAGSGAVHGGAAFGGRPGGDG